MLRVFISLVVIFSIAASTIAFGLPPKLPRFASRSTFLPATTADFKNGLTFEVEGVPFKLIEFLHVKPGKGSAFVRSKVKNMSNGSVQERTFRAGETINIAQLDKVDMQYTFTEGDLICFMNMESFEEVKMPKSRVDNEKLLKPGLQVKTLIWKGDVIDVELPTQVEYTVVECPPNFAGNSAQGVTKPATLDTGAVIDVPMFIEVQIANCAWLHNLSTYIHCLYSLNCLVLLSGWN